MCSQEQSDVVNPKCMATEGSRKTSCSSWHYSLCHLYTGVLCRLYTGVLISSIDKCVCVFYTHLGSHNQYTCTCVCVTYTQLCLCHLYTADVVYRGCFAAYQTAYYKVLCGNVSHVVCTHHTLSSWKRGMFE